MKWGEDVNSGLFFGLFRASNWLDGNFRLPLAARPEGVISDLSIYKAGNRNSAAERTDELNAGPRDTLGPSMKKRNLYADVRRRRG